MDRPGTLISSWWVVRRRLGRRAGAPREREGLGTTCGPVGRATFKFGSSAELCPWARFLEELSEHGKEAFHAESEALGREASTTRTRNGTAHCAGLVKNGFQLGSGSPRTELSLGYRRGR